MNVLKLIKKKELKKQSTLSQPQPLKYKTKKIMFQTSGLDLDDLIQPELPNEYDADKHEELISQLGEELIESLKRYSRDQKNENLMNNDDFQILLALLRKRKEQTIERVPYYVDYNTKLESVYKNDRDEVYGTEEKEKNFYINIDNFIKEFIQFD
jgi:hypothetical protein